MSDLPQADRIAGLPHPCETQYLFGHDAACAQVLEAFNGDRMHHAWMLTGPKGLAKPALPITYRVFCSSPSQPETASLARRRQQQAFSCPPITLWRAALGRGLSRAYVFCAGQ